MGGPPALLRRIPSEYVTSPRAVTATYLATHATR